MTDSIIPFPLSNDDLYRQAKKAVEVDQNERQALHYLSLILQQEPNYWQAYALASDIYLSQKNAQGLRRLWNYFLTPTTIQQLPDELVESFLESFLLLQSTVEDKLLLYELRETHTLTVDELEQIQQLLATLASVDHSQQKIDYLNSLPINQLIPEINSMTKSERQTIIQQLLSRTNSKDAHVIQHLIISAKVPLALRYQLLLKVSDYLVGLVDYRWRQQLVKVDLQSVQPIETLALYQQVQQLVQDYCQNYEPHMEEMLIDLFYEQFIYFFPHYQVIEQSVEQWFYLTLHQLGLPLPQVELAADLTAQSQWLEDFLKQMSI